MSYRTRVPGTTGTELDFESREKGHAALVAVTASMPLAGAVAPIVTGNRRRGQASVFGTALAPARDAGDGSANEADTHERCEG